MQPGEQVVCQFKRHPVGIIGMYVIAGILVIILAVAAFILVPNAMSSSRGAATGIGAIIFILLTGIILGFVFVSNKVYWGNSWVVTTDSITQITQTSLFSKQSSQLSLGNLEDVSSEKNGILAQMFNFGLIRAETAGERSKFMFPYCPNPDYYAQKILAAREQFEQVHHGGKQEPTYSVPHAPAQPQDGSFQQPQQAAAPEPMPPAPSVPFTYPGQAQVATDQDVPPPYAPPVMPPAQQTGLNGQMGYQPPFPDTPQAPAAPQPDPYQVPSDVPPSEDSSSGSHPQPPQY